MAQGPPVEFDPTSTLLVDCTAKYAPLCELFANATPEFRCLLQWARTSCSNSDLAGGRDHTAVGDALSTSGFSVVDRELGMQR